MKYGDLMGYHGIKHWNVTGDIHRQDFSDSQKWNPHDDDFATFYVGNVIILVLNHCLVAKSQKDCWLLSSILFAVWYNALFYCRLLVRSPQCLNPCLLLIKSIKRTSW